MSEGKVVLVTGCAKGGIGYEYCKAFAEQNCRVFATDIPEAMHGMQDFDSDENNNVEMLELDVLSDQSVSTAVNSVVSKCGRIDILINNAGVGGTGPLAELPLDEVRKAFEVNTLGQLRMIQHVVPHMASRRYGKIVNVGSIVGTVPTPWAGSYCATKAAVHAMSHALRVELRPLGVDVILVLPGSVRSNFGNNSLEKIAKYDWKLYENFKDSIADRAMASQGEKAANATLLARHVAMKVLSPKPPKQIVYGHMTGLFAFFSISPLWVRDFFFRTKFKIR